MRRHWAHLLFFAGLGFGGTTLAAPTCDTEDGVQMTGAPGAPWNVQILLDPQGVPLNQPFSAKVIVCSGSDHRPTRLEIDATMPAHKHGMNYTTKTTQIEEDLYQVDNLLFHMPGIWRLEVTAYENKTPHRYIHDVTPR